MSDDIERLLAAAADDTDRPLNTSADEIVVRARRSARGTRIAAISTSVLTAAVIIGGAAAWSANRTDGEAPVAGTPSRTVTIDVKTGWLIDAETGKPIAPAPPVSRVSDSAIIERCAGYDKQPRYGPKPSWDKAGPVTAQWKVAVKTSSGTAIGAVLVSPDRTVVAVCNATDGKYPSWSFGRRQLSRAPADGLVFEAGRADGLRVPDNVTKVLVEVPGENVLREALLGSDGIYTIGVVPNRPGPKPSIAIQKPRIRAYDANGRKVLDRVIPFAIQKLPVIPSVSTPR
ncbi:hypothetical protein [Kribbella solani]|uniref:Uncharacterized protein n=1 Tax=Kribbella solani TaxID=236067 RepID=A0A841DG06_9ACTN|nr:hypothetical protein [Kribbella solani]MBB5978034.1 hypothetical protein [Kribbella solani]